SPTRMSASSTRAVSIRTGTGRSAWIRRHTSCPSYPGSITSRTTTSGSCSPYAATAPGPSYARTTSYPSAPSRSETAWLITGSSSTTRTRRLAGLMSAGYERSRARGGEDVWRLCAGLGGSGRRLRRPERVEVADRVAVRLPLLLEDHVQARADGLLVVGVVRVGASLAELLVRHAGQKGAH